MYDIQYVPKDDSFRTSKKGMSKWQIFNNSHLRINESDFGNATWWNILLEYKVGELHKVSIHKIEFWL